MERHKLPLFINEVPLYVINEKLEPLKEELEQFLDGMNYMKSRKFSSNVLFSHEIQANNVIEGYYDDVSLIDNIIYHKLNISDKQRKKRILNLYKGYRYILEEGKEINENTLRELYTILSKGLLEEDDRKNMGEYYRKNDVFIYYSSNLAVEPDLGIPASLISNQMKILLQYMNASHNEQCLTDTYLISQIAHFYFCYIHPYYDINGRTSRTTSMWYLLNHDAYPYIIFNRGIQMSKQEYYQVIRDVKKYKNITYFLNYMMHSVKMELEKEYIMELIAQSCNSPLTSVDYQSMQYILSMRGQITYLDFARFYNKHNEPRKFSNIYQTMLEPLLDKSIILPTKPTTKMCSNGNSNYFFELNPTMYELDPVKIKRIELAKIK